MRPELWSDAVWMHPSPQDGQKVGTRSGPGQAGLLRAVRSAPGSSRLRLERGARAGLAESPSQPCRHGGMWEAGKDFGPFQPPWLPFVVGVLKDRVCQGRTGLSLVPLDLLRLCRDPGSQRLNFVTVFPQGQDCGEDPMLTAS